MNRVWPGSAALPLVARVGSVLSVLMLVVGLAGWGTVAHAADGPQGSPSLQPSAVLSANEPFSIVPPAGARCEEEGAGRPGSAGWRWHAFIVEVGRDLATLEFGPTGPGSDFDATDGQITAGLISSGRGIWNEVPAEQPEGLIDPDGVGGVVLDPSDYTLADGGYVVGIACSDEASVTRQWWSLEVEVQTAGSPFLTTAGAADDAAATPADPVAATATSTANAGDAASSGSSTSSAIAGGVDPAPAEAAGAIPASSAGGDENRPSGVSWTPLVAIADTSSVLPIRGWAALAVVFGRIAYLLTRPVRISPSMSP